MPDDVHARLVRLETSAELDGKRTNERILDLEARVSRYERAAEERHREVLQHIRDEFQGWKKLMHEAIDAAGKIHDAKLAIQVARNSDLRKIAVAVLIAAIVGVLGWLFTNLSGNHPARYTPPLPPYHSSEEPRERNRR